MYKLAHIFFRLARVILWNLPIPAQRKSQIRHLIKTMFWQLPISHQLKLTLRKIILLSGASGENNKLNASNMNGSQDSDDPPRNGNPVASVLPFEKFYQLREQGADGSWEWNDYIPLRSMHLNAESSKKAPPKPHHIDRVDEKNFSERLEKLNFSISQRVSISVVVPAFNEPEMTCQCLETVTTALKEANLFESSEVILADDASDDERFSSFREVQGLYINRSDNNVGFIKNCNAAAEIAKGDMLLFLNNDVLLERNCIKHLTYALKNCADAGAVGPRLIYPSGVLQEAGTMLNANGTARMVGLGDDPLKPQYAFTRPVDYISGACLLTFKSHFSKIGGFSEDYAPMYYEDADFALKLQESGKRCYYVGEAFAYHELSATTSKSGKYNKLSLINKNRSKFLKRWRRKLLELNAPKLLAFYLPQMHQVPENDYWWGKGFTEWSNVAKGQPNYLGQYQPRVPADLGFYNLKDPSVFEEQAKLARRYGLHGFIFYYYRFKDGRMLHKPLDLFLNNPQIDINFSLCWANENWTRRWDGKNDDVIKSQDYSLDALLEVLSDLTRYSEDPRYIRVNGRPVLFIYRYTELTASNMDAEKIKLIAAENGFQKPYIVIVESMNLSNDNTLKAFRGVDMHCQFPPHNLGLPLKDSLSFFNEKIEVNDYRHTALYAASRIPAEYPRIPGAAIGWDNTSRNKSYGSVLECGSPGSFQFWLETALAYATDFLQGEEKFVTINAWNEWAEGAYLEPDTKFGHGYLEAVDRVLTSSRLDTY